MKAPAVTLEKNGHVGIVAIDAPPANTFTDEVVSELGSILDRIGGDRSVRSVLFRSLNEKIFLSGGDIKLSANAVISGEIGSQIEYVRKIQQVANKLAELDRPTVAAINGHALGGGFEMITACDFRSAVDKDTVQLGMPEVDVGFIPALGALERVGRKFGGHLALRMGLGLRLNPKEAFGLGLVDELHSEDGLDEASLSMAARLAELPTKAVGMVKSILLQGAGKEPQEINEIELRCLREILDTEDVQEGVRAFLDRRKPQFKGR